MLNEEALEKLGDRISQRIESLNTYMLKELGNQIATIGNLTPSQAYQLLQSIKYGNDLQKITTELARITKLTELDIYSIFEEVVNGCEAYSIPYYKYKGINYIPYKENLVLQNQVKAYTKLITNEFNNLLNTSAFMINDGGKVVFTDLSKTYQKVTEQAVFSIAQGRDSYTEAIRKATKQLANNGIQTVDYASGYHRRLDTSVRMNVLEGARNLQNELLMQFGKEWGSDGVEISHHINSAPDHIDTVDGKQFTNEEYEELQNTLERPVGKLNCYHFPMPIIYGEKPQYTNEQLEEDKKNNKNGFEFEGKHYTNYEGTQLQRRLETAIRRNKEQKMFYEKWDEEEADKYTLKIRQLTRKYNELSKISGLPTRIERLKIK